MNEWKKIVFYAIVPAFIAGVFAIAPKLYDVVTEPKAVLQYSITRGPAIKDDQGYKSIYAIDVVNRGKKALNNVLAIIKTEGVLEGINIFEDSGLSPVISEDKNNSIVVNTLHPEESFTISVMLETKQPQITFDFVLRSNEVLGQKLLIDGKSNSKLSSLSSGLFSGMSVFLMSIYLMSRVKGGLSIPFIDKPNTLYFLAARLELTDILRAYGISEGNITYLRFSDMLFAFAQKDDENKNKAITGLKCMLLISNIAKSSVLQIKRNIKSLEGDLYDENHILELRNDSEKIKNQLDLRNAIESYIDTPQIV
ncbi:hypothetical protein [Aliivibrio fischeri]|uniref:hypothetical protein n=1 Tax=Aliivibrio fischeri TaxID=668 RepID=UPI0012DA4363|nr:hypothetical protein [Aliivibrio fischeri]MUL15876.1 hypothetical protein [Aliivibrio fischeri]